MEGRTPPLGLDARFIATSTTTLCLTHHANWGKLSEELRAHDASGKIVFSVRINTMGAHQRKELLDPEGQLLINTSTRVWKTNRETKGFFSDGKEAFVAKQEDKSGRTGIVVDFADPLRGNTHLVVRAAGRIATKATVEDGQGVVAEIKWGRTRKKEGPKKARSGDRLGTDYDLVIAAGVDTALMTIVCAVYSAMRTEKAAAVAADISGAVAA